MVGAWFSMGSVFEGVRSLRGVWRGTSWIVTLSTVATLGVLVMAVLTLQAMHDDAWRRAERNAQNILRLIEQDAARNLELFDLSLDAVSVGLSLRGLAELSPELRYAVLFDRGTTAKYLGTIRALDQDGRTIAESRPGSSTVSDYEHRDYFQHHRLINDDRLFVSAPFKSNRTGELSIAISRRLSRPDGSFGGVVVGTLRLDYFRDLFSRLEIGPRDAISLIREDGTFLMRQPFLPAEIGRSVATSPIFRNFVGVRSGAFVAHATIDHVERAYTFSRVGDYPLIASVAMSVDDIFAAWMKRAMIIGPIVLGLCLLTTLLTGMLHRELRRRTRAEAEAKAANAELSRLAVTDALTGLANRRLFDAMLNREWRRCARTGCSVSLLMIDADNFKSYNDLYGHLAGDGVLRAVADHLVASVRPLQDLVCRVGGEEFSILLPQTGEVRALRIAETIRMAIAQAAMPHRGRPEGHVTISVGVAQARPSDGTTISAFIEAADRALYEGKAGGRNQVRSGRAVQVAPSSEIVADRAA